MPAADAEEIRGGAVRGPFGISNANARRVADALEAEGIACEFYYPGESEEVETAKAVTR